MPMKTNNSKLLDKENQVEGVRRARQAPDFSKLHKQWDAKLQKGKAVVKKPLTQSQPFQLSQTNQGEKSFISNDDFVVDEKSKRSILNGSGITNKSPAKAKRATIAGTSRISQRSAIPIPNIHKRGSLYAKPSKVTITPRKLHDGIAVQKTFSAVKPAQIKVPKPKSISNSEKNLLQGNLQDLNFDFKCDDNALESILNCEGIKADQPTARQSSQYGPQRSNKNRAVGRIVPFQKPHPNSRYSFHSKTTSAMPAAKERWSIYSRDSFSTKPDLMTWLKQLTEGSKAKRDSIYTKDSQSKRDSIYTKPPTISNFTADDTFHNTNYSLQTNNTQNETQSKINPKEANFSRTVVGYQGNEGPMIKEEDDMWLNTPLKLNKISLQADDSSLRSILKKREIGSTLQDIRESEDNVRNNATKQLFNNTVKTMASHQHSIKKTLLASKTSIEKIGTPIRLSAYARSQIKQGKPLPKQNRYEQMGEKITSPQVEESEPKPHDNQDKHVQNDNETDPSKQNMLASYISPLPNSSKGTNVSTVKRVRWADVNTDASQSKLIDGSFALPAILPVQRSITESFNSSHQHAHKIKFVLPAEQPLEKSSIKEESSITSVDLLMKDISPASLSVSCLPEQKKESWAAILGKEIKEHSSGSIANLSSISVDAGKNNSSALLRSFEDATTRPLPQLDEKVLKDLISFQDESDDLDDLDKFIPTNENAANEDVPFQSTLIATPSMIYEESINVGFTPLNKTESEVPIAPLKQQTRARTPYKQEMFDTYLRMLAEAKQKNSSTLNCTVGGETESTLNDTTITNTTITNAKVTSTIESQSKENTEKPIITVEALLKQQIRYDHIKENSKNDYVLRIPSNSQNFTTNSPVNPFSFDINEEQKNLPTSTVNQNNNMFSRSNMLRENNFKSSFQSPLNVQRVNNNFMLSAIKQESNDIIENTVFMKQEPIFDTSLPNHDTKRNVKNNEPSNQLHHTNSVSELPSQLQLTNHVSESSNQLQNTNHVISNLFNGAVTNIRSPSMNKFPSAETSNVFALTNQKLGTFSQNACSTLLRPSSLSDKQQHAISAQKPPSALFRPSSFSEINANKNNTTTNFLRPSSFSNINPNTKVANNEPPLPSNDALRPGYFSNLSNATLNSSKQIHTSSTVTGDVTVKTNAFLSVVKHSSANTETLCSSHVSTPFITSNTNAETDKFKIMSLEINQRNNQKTIEPIKTFRQSDYSNHSLSNKQVKNKNILKPSMLAARLQSNNVEGEPVKKISQSSSSELTSLVPQNITFYNPMLKQPTIFNDTVNETFDSTSYDSTFFGDDDTDVCMVISKGGNPPMINKPTSFSPVVTKVSVKKRENTVDSLEKQTMEGQLTIGANSAFSRLPATCHVFPKNPIVPLKEQSMSKQMADMRTHDILSPEVHSVIDAEVSLYIKFAEITDRFTTVRKKREGATNPVSHLLTYGDEKHFVPIPVN